MAKLTDRHVMYAAGGVAGVAGLMFALNATNDRAAKTEAIPGSQEKTGGPPVGQVGGLSDFGAIYVAQKTEAARRFGLFPRTASQAMIPIVSVRYAVEQVANFWMAQINRLCGLEGDRAVTLTHRPGSLAELSAEGGPFGGITFATYDGLVEMDAADQLLAAWKRHGGQMMAALAQGVTGSQIFNFSRQLDAAAAERFWDGVQRLAVAVDIDRAFVDNAKGWAWSAIVESAQDVAGVAGDVAREAAKQVAGAAGGLLGALLTGVGGVLITSPLFLAAGAAALYLYRREVAGFLGRL